MRVRENLSTNLLLRTQMGEEGQSEFTNRDLVNPDTWDTPDGGWLRGSQGGSGARSLSKIQPITPLPCLPVSPMMNVTMIYI